MTGMIAVGGEITYGGGSLRRRLFGKALHRTTESLVYSGNLLHQPKLFGEAVSGALGNEIKLFC